MSKYIALFLFIAACSAGINFYEKCSSYTDCNHRAMDALGNVGRQSITDFLMPTALDNKFGIKTSDSLATDFAVQVSNFREQANKYKAEDEKWKKDLDQKTEQWRVKVETIYNENKNDPNRPFKF